MPRILAATDFSLRSQRAVRRAGLVARQCRAELVLVHVVDDDQPAEMIELERREANKFLNEQIVSLSELQNLRCRAKVAIGEAFDAALRTAEDYSTELNVMGTHRKQLLRDIFIGTTIERVVRTGPYPVLMVNREVVSPYQRLLAAVDMSDPSAHALEVASAMGLTDSRVVVVHALLRRRGSCSSPAPRESGSTSMSPTNSARREWNWPRFWMRVESAVPVGP